MNNSPFTYGTTVSKRSFTNRKEEFEKLRSNLLQGVNTMLISPRRWGKSSLVEKVIADINAKEKKIYTLILDLFSISSEQEFLEAFAREVIKASSSQWEEWVKSGKTFFKLLIPKISLGVDPASDFSISFNWDELDKHKDEILNLPEVIAQKKGKQFIICLDEFQNLSSFKTYEQFEKRMRAIWQRQKVVTYCLYGSKRHMMTDIFNNPSKPFYRFGDMMFLQKISGEDWVKFIVKGFKNTGKTISKKHATFIPEKMKNHSWYTQQLAHYTWQKTENKVDAEVMNSAISELLSANLPFYQKVTDALSVTQVNLLKAIANNERHFTSAKTMQDYKLGTPRNVSKNKISLYNHDLIDDVGGKLEFLDPAFELWFKKQFLNQAVFLI